MRRMTFTAFGALSAQDASASMRRMTQGGYRGARTRTIRCSTFPKDHTIMRRDQVKRAMTAAAEACLRGDADAAERADLALADLRRVDAEIQRVRAADDMAPAERRATLYGLEMKRAGICSVRSAVVTKGSKR